MYCVNCGKELVENATFCSSCGNRVGDARRTSYATERNTGLALLLAIIWTGAGHLYVGQIGKGIMIMAASVGVTVIAYATFLVIHMFGLVFLLVPLIIYIWSIFDAYGLAKRYNDELRRTGNPPW